MNNMDVYNLTPMKKFPFFTFTILRTATTRIILCDVPSVVWPINNEISEEKAADQVIKAASYLGTSLHIYQDIRRHTHHTVTLSFLMTLSFVGAVVPRSV